MAIKITFSRAEYASFSQIIQTRIDVGLEILQGYLEGYFEPTRLGVWLYAPMSELGGKEIGVAELNVGSAREIRKPIDSLMNKISKNDLYQRWNTVIHIIGKWKLNDNEPEGYFSINNAPNWKGVYGDIDMDAYPTEQHEDFMDMIWDNDSLRNEMVNNLYEKFIKNYNTSYANYSKILKLDWACFASGVPSPSEISNYRSAYYSSVRAYLMDILEAFAQNNWVQRSLRLRYILDTLYGIKEFTKKVDNILDRFQISKREGGSVMLIGQESDSFARLYNEFSEDFLTPLFHGLPEDKSINRKIENVVKNQSTLFPDIDEGQQRF